MKLPFSPTQAFPIEAFTEGKKGRLYFRFPHLRPGAVEAAVQQIDRDTAVFRLTGPIIAPPPLDTVPKERQVLLAGAWVWTWEESNTKHSGTAAPAAGDVVPSGPGEGAARMNHWIKGGPDEGTITFWVKPPRLADLTDTSASRFPTTEHGGITVETEKNSDRTITVTLNGTRGGPFIVQGPIPPCASLGLHVRITWNAETVILYLNELEAGRINASPHYRSGVMPCRLSDIDCSSSATFWSLLLRA